GYNLYGPTEYTINTLGAGTTDSHTPTIGKPIWNTTTHILDHHLQPVPPGTPGELYITGTGLARGYLGNPALTAQRFTANPYGPPGTRLYRTGDLARRRPDGTIDYLGRTDDQIKIRGHRIEPTEIQTTLGNHPEITQNAIIPTQGPDGSVQLTAYVVPADPDAETPDDVSVRTELAESEAEQVAEWRQIYADEYTEIDTAVFTEDDFAGWDSSYDGAPIPVPHMQEWRDETVSRIAALRPRRVLEIGVGTGLILGRVAPLCESYWGTDFAAPVIAKLRRDIDARDPGLAAKVELRTAAAHDLSGLPEGFFDTVVVNSVIQYFPSAAYLTGVLRQALELVVPGGSVFVGDVRNLRLIRAFHTAIHVGQAAPDADDASVRAAIERGVLLEKELLIDPDYFAALAEQLPELGGVDLRIKRGHHHNELSRHRYDVVLHRRPLAADAAHLDSAPTRAWQAEDPGQLAALAEQLRDEYPASLRVSGIPNARLTGELAAVRVLENGGGIAEARAALRSDAPVSGVAHIEPELLYALGENHGYVVAATWTPGSPGSFDVVFARPDGADTAAFAGTYAVPGARRGSLAAYTNSPAAGRNAGTLVPRLRAHLRERLPEYMVPSAFVVLDRLPLTVNGKLDRKALPAPDAGAGRRSGRAASTPTEKALCLLFSEVLGVSDVSAEDSFFDLGGHSLLAARLAAKARATLGMDLAIRDVFGAPTPAALAELVTAEDAVAGPTRPAPAPRSEHGPVALSFAQRRLWLLSQFDTASAAYHEPIAVRMRGKLDVAALRAAVQDVTDRHETLRTLCVESDASSDGATDVFQYVLSPEQARVVVEFTDLTDSPPTAAPGAVGRADATRVTA
ncbi:MAG TPA: AMP-binding protein, partial [Yinghuangia sp.]|nr:AMP-binding protein [Yinghuangia sp.]